VAVVTWKKLKNGFSHRTTTRMSSIYYWEGWGLWHSSSENSTLGGWTGGPDRPKFRWVNDAYLQHKSFLVVVTVVNPYIWTSPRNFNIYYVPFFSVRSDRSVRISPSLLLFAPPFFFFLNKMTSSQQPGTAWPISRPYARATRAVSTNSSIRSASSE
jgi:hypothetical protein